MITSNPFFLPKIYDYWDSRTASIVKMAERIDSLPDDELGDALVNIQQCVKEHLRVLSDEQLCQVAYVVADDLYKTASWITCWNTSVKGYLMASATTLFSETRRRGYSLHYSIDNSFLETQRPFELFPMWFRAAGIKYECPQLTASADGTTYQAALLSCSVRLRDYATSRDHYVFLDFDCSDASFVTPAQQSSTPGVITVFRNAAPEPGSKIAVQMPVQFA